MNTPLELLVIEDDPADFLLLTRHLRTQGLAAACTQVASTAELEAALDTGAWAAVLADYKVPGMRFETTLEWVRQRWPDLPIILVSGAVGEEQAVELLRRGVGDFVLKDHLIRLIPAIERCLREAVEQRARRTAEAALRESEERLRLALEGGDLGMWDWDVVSDVVVVNPRWVAMLGYGQADLPHCRSDWEMLVHPDDLPVLRQASADLLEDRLPFVAFDHRLRHRDGHWVWVFSRGKTIARSPQGRPVRVCGTHQDISVRKLVEEEWHRLASTDPLTGILNRRSLKEAMEAETRRTRRHGRPLTLIMFDLDWFKAINDTYGHDQGDAVLVAVTAQIRDRLRQDDSLARWGGEEFMILLPETPLAQAVALAETLRIGLQTSPCPGVEPVTASFGVTAYRPDETLDEWLERVDGLVYQVKRAGRDGVASS